MTGLFTLDTVMALLVAVTMMTGILTVLSERTTDSTENLFQTAQDILVLSEKTGDLGKALDGNAEGIEDYGILLSNRVCFELRIRDREDKLVYYLETDCAKKGSQVVTKRSFIHRKNFYMASMRAWYR